MKNRDQASQGPGEPGAAWALSLTVPTSIGPFFDLQVNGYAGVDFNSDGLTASALHAACEQLRADGVAGILATIITDDLGKMCARLGRLADLCDSDPLARQMVQGFHIEGPFLNENTGYIGAHPARHAMTARADAMERLVQAAAGRTRLVTLAPERDPGLRVTRLLAERGILIAAGHTDASLDQLRAALDAGLSMFTHLGNGCPLTLPRHDNIVQRVLSLAERFTAISFIADGAHIPLFSLRNYLRIVPEDRVVIVSDSISAAGLGPGRYTLAGQEVCIGADLVPRAAAGHLVGSACPLARMAENLRQIGIDDSTIVRWLADTPSQLLGLDGTSDIL